jgi:hypothetical protein
MSFPSYTYNRFRKFKQLILSFQTNKNGTFSGSLIPSSGTFLWDYGDGSPLDETNTPSHLYSDGTIKTVKVYQNTASTTIIQCLLQSNNILGEFDFSLLNINGTFDLNINSITSILFSSSNTITFGGVIRISNNNISGNANLSSFTLNSAGFVDIFNNPGITSFTQPSISGTTRGFRANGCNLNGNVDISNIRIIENAGFNVSFKNNTNLTGITFSSLPNASQTVDLSNTAATSYDLSSWTFTDRLFINDCISLSSITWNSTNPITTGLSQMLISNCALTQQSEIDQIFAFQDNYFTDGGVNDPIKNLLTDVSGGTNSAPSTTGTNAITSLQTKFTNNGFTYTANTN